jgi:peptide-methionine (S)-S-oxide reductase
MQASKNLKNSTHFRPTVKYTNNKTETPMLAQATFAAGCFWGVEDSFQQLKGVVNTKVGYTGGETENPTYDMVCTGKTGHVEAVEILYDPSEISYIDLLELFWNIHDPTTRDRQGPDIGSQYCSVIFYHNENQKKLAHASKMELQKSGNYDKKIVTEIISAKVFYPAEEYHQSYFKKHGKTSCSV